MRKVNPADVCDDFRDEIASLERFLTDSIAAAPSSKNQSLLAELVFHRAYVAVESFISAWVVGAINWDSSQYINQRSHAIYQSLRTRFSSWDAAHIEYSPPTHIPVPDLETLLDPDGLNISFKNYVRFEERAKEWLTPAFASKVTGVPNQRKQIIDAAKSIRNCVAHQSKSSFTEMNTSLGALPRTGVAQHLRTTVNAVTNVGAHLKARVSGNMRVEHHLGEFKRFGGDLS